MISFAKINKVVGDTTQVILGRRRRHVYVNCKTNLFCMIQPKIKFHFWTGSPLENIRYWHTSKCSSVSNVNWFNMINTCVCWTFVNIYYLCFTFLSFSSFQHFWNVQLLHLVPPAEYLPQFHILKLKHLKVFNLLIFKIYMKLCSTLEEFNIYRRFETCCTSWTHETF